MKNGPTRLLPVVDNDRRHAGGLNGPVAELWTLVSDGADIPEEAAIMPHTGQNADKTGTFVCQSCGATITMEQGEHLPPCPRERAAVEWRFRNAGQQS